MVQHWCSNHNSRESNGDSFAELDFTVLSGERRPDSGSTPLPDDGSESVTVILSGIPEGRS